jgi:hypothetical protein
MLLRNYVVVAIRCLARPTVWAGAVVAAATIVATVALLGTPSEQRTRPLATFGQIPSGAFTTHGIKWQLAPTYVSVVSHGRLVGFAPKRLLEQLDRARLGPRSGGSYEPSPDLSLVPVYDRSLGVVGHIYPGTGFVANGAPPRVTVTTVLGGRTPDSGNSGSG